MRIDRQQGVSLIENMVALLIFAAGILGMIAMLSVSIKNNSDARNRNDASSLANQIVGRMWVDDKANAALKLNYESPSGAKYLAWEGQVESSLPNAVSYPPTITVDAQNVAVVTIQWKAPGKNASSRYTLSAAVTP